MEDSNKIINEVTSSDYKYGFVTDIDTEMIHRGLDEETVRIISAKKNEPDWLLQFRLKAFRHWQTLEMPTSDDSADRLSGYNLLRRSEEKGRPEKPGRSRPGVIEDFR